MSARDRILEAAMMVFRRHGFRRSSMEETADAAGLTRQGLYHHFRSKEVLFRAVIERVHDEALASGRAAADAAEQSGGTLTDILMAQINARFERFVASFEGSPHVEELFSEHLIQGRDLYQHYATLYAGQTAATIERACHRQPVALVPDMTVIALARCIELAINGVKSAYPSMLPADAFLRDTGLIVRTLVKGATMAPASSHPGAFLVPHGDRK